MNDYLLSVILGIVEGLTEFLPVSSTAHLRVSEVLLHISLGDGYWKMYTIVIQLGAILCLPVYFRQRIAKFLSTFPAGENGDRTALTHPLGLTVVAFVVTAIPAFLMTKIIGQHLESLTIMGTSLLVGGIVMWIVDAHERALRGGRAERPARSHSYLENGSHEPGAGNLDRCLPDSLRRLPRDLAVDVHDCGRTIGRHVTGFRPRVFVLSFHSDDGGGHGIRSAEIGDGKRAEPDRGRAN